jgi:hypothetical protein
MQNWLVSIVTKLSSARRVEQQHDNRRILLFKKKNKSTHKINHALLGSLRLSFFFFFLLSTIKTHKTSNKTLEHES